MKRPGMWRGHQLVHAAPHEAHVPQVLRDHAHGQAVHVRPGHARLHGRLHRAVGGEHRLVHVALLRREPAVHRVGAGDVGGVPVVLGAGVVQEQVPVPHLAVVGRALVAVVEDRGVRAAPADARVGGEAAAGLVVDLVEEQGLHLVLHRARPAPAHDLHVGRARDRVHPGQQPQLLRRLGAPGTRRGADGAW